MYRPIAVNVLENGCGADWYVKERWNADRMYQKEDLMKILLCLLKTLIVK